MTAVHKLQETYMTVQKSAPKKSEKGEVRKAVKSVSVKILSPQQKLFLMEIVELHMTKGFTSTAKYLGEQLGTTRHSAANIMRELVAQGWLVQPAKSANTYEPGPEFTRLMKGQISNDSLHEPEQTSNESLPSSNDSLKSGNERLPKGNESLPPLYSIPTEPSINLQLTNSEATAPQPEPINLHQEALATYDLFHKKRVGVPAHINGKQGQAMKDLLNYLRRVVAEKSGIAEPDENEILKAWQYILSSWQKLDAWYQEKLTIAEILQNITNILNQLRNGNGKQQNTATSNANAADEAKAFLRASRGGS
jgi:hypothetical protein